MYTIRPGTLSVIDKNVRTYNKPIRVKETRARMENKIQLKHHVDPIFVSSYNANMIVIKSDIKIFIINVNGNIADMFHVGVAIPKLGL